jgi:hypothetical protein
VGTCSVFRTGVSGSSPGSSVLSAENVVDLVPGGLARKCQRPFFLSGMKWIFYMFCISLFLLLLDVSACEAFEIILLAFQ